MPANPTQSEIDPTVIAQWQLSPVKPLSGRINQHWLVEHHRKFAVLRRYAQIHTDKEYELTVLRHLHERGWSVPNIIEKPIYRGGAWWCLFSFIPGTPKHQTGKQEQRSRGHLLAELHDTTTLLNPLGQRRGFTRADTVISDPALLAAVTSYERIQPEAAHLMRWHIDRACERFEQLALDSAEQIVLHSDFTTWNLLFDGETLSGILDFESTHLNFRVADFALAWRGHYDDVIRGYEEIHLLSELDWQLLVPVFWAWLFLGVKDEIGATLNGQAKP